MPIHNPWYKIKLSAPVLASGKPLELHVPHDVFSTQRIDDGTLLLLKNLPETTPAKILDMGCGYGALGIPLAAAYPSTEIEMVDRDLLAVHWSTLNAQANQLKNVRAYGSLGFDEVGSSYDWILCNVPARIGRPFIKNLLAAHTRLTPNGEMRIVVIRDLVPLIEEIKNETLWPITEIARGYNHVIFSVRSAGAPHRPLVKNSNERDSLYLRDQVNITGLTFDRPFDLGGDDPKRLKDALPALLECLPSSESFNSSSRILCFRCSYGQLALISRKKWPDAAIIAIDRDLLAIEFTRRNAHSLQLAGDHLDIRANAHFPNALNEDERFDLILGELSPSAEEKVAEAELLAIRKHLTPKGQALVLCMGKFYRNSVERIATRNDLNLTSLVSRNGYETLLLRL